MLVNTHDWKPTIGFIFVLGVLFTAYPVVSQPEAGVSAMDMRKARIVEQLVSEAEQALRQGRLTTPADNNAYDRLRAAEKLNPGSTRVAAAMQALRASYLSRIDKALAQGDAAGAEALLGRARRVAANSEALNARQAQLDDLYASLPPPSAEPDASDRVWLSPTDLRDRSAPIVKILHELALTVKETDAAIHIFARTDEEGRWIYSTLKEAVPGYRIRGDIRVNARPYIQLMDPLS